jgi:hypothetical protein
MDDFQEAGGDDGRPNPGWKATWGEDASFTSRRDWQCRTRRRPGLGTSPAEILHGVRVLVVDDNSTDRRILRGMLTTFGGACFAPRRCAGAGRNRGMPRMMRREQSERRADGLTVPARAAKLD